VFELSSQARQDWRRNLIATRAASFELPEIAELYEEAATGVLAELEQVPGYGIAMEMLAERFAFLWATQKQMDLAGAEPSEYQQLTLRLLQVYDRLLKARDERHAEDAFKRQFTAFFVNAVADTIAELEPDRARGHALQQAPTPRWCRPLHLRRTL
jgi:hypothetical protein